MKKVLIATEKPFAKVAVDKIKAVLDAAGYQTILLEKYKEKADLLKAVAEVDAMIIRSDIADREVLEAGKNLKIVVRAGAGYDNIDLVAATEKGICAMNTPGQNANAVAELAFGMMVYLARNSFSPSDGGELRGKTLGILAYGNIGKYVGEIAKGFGMEVYAFDPFVSKEVIEKAGIKVAASIEDLFAKCQYVSLHIPANKDTKQSINEKLLASMPQGAVLVNTARKEIINEADLLKIMESRKDFKYISDIEPDCKAEIAEKYKGRFYFTPKKMGAQTEEANVNAGIASANQIVAFFEKGDRKFQVNK